MANKKLIMATTILLTLFILAAPALAAKDVGEIFEGLGEQGGAVGTALVIIAAVGGLFLIIIGFI